jgi:hypothetical protein
MIKKGEGDRNEQRIYKNHGGRAITANTVQEDQERRDRGQTKTGVK